MKSILRLRDRIRYETIEWRESRALPGVRYGLRRISLGQRLELNRRAKELSLRHEFLTSGDVADKLDASFSDLLVARLYLEWGIAEISGLEIDGQPATVLMTIEQGPEPLIQEMLEAVRGELALSTEERKNS